MTTRILRATPVGGMVALKLQTSYQRFLDALNSFAEAKMRQCSPGSRAAQGATRDQSLSPADACQSQHAEDRHSGPTLAMLAQFHQPNQWQDMPAKEATLIPSDVETIGMEGGNIEHALDLSASRAYNSALEILGAYKLTGNFHINLEIVLKDIDAFDKVTFEVEPKSQLPYSPDCRHVLFRPNENVRMSQFSEIMRSMKSRIGFDATRPWWVRALSLSSA